MVVAHEMIQLPIPVQLKVKAKVKSVPKHHLRHRRHLRLETLIHLTILKLI